MIRASSAILLAPALLVATAPAGAQRTVPRYAGAGTTVQPGARVRVTVASAFRQSPFGARIERLHGTVRAISPEALHLELPNVPRAVAIRRASIRRVEISAGHSRRPGALRVGTVGALILGLSMLAAHQDPESRRFDEAWQAAAVGGAVGFGVGAWFGGRWPREQWRAVRLRE